jgi:large subunit ribosomal protein L19
MNTVDKITRENLRTDLPKFNVGDTVKVQVKISEGDGKTTRLQAFAGVVIAIKGSGKAQTFTIRRVSFGQGVERIFPFQSPQLQSVSVEKRGVVRRAKLYYLRDKVGKSARIKEKRKF